LRAIFFLLLLANLAFFAWATLIDVTPEPPSDSIAQLPRLQLLSEVKGREPAASHGSGAAKGVPPAMDGVPTSPGSSPTQTNGTSAASPTQDSVAAGDPASPTLSSAGSPAATGSAERCVTIGPFGDPGRASEATELLQDRGFAPRPRVAGNHQPQGYWVYIGGLKSASAETSTVRLLERNGLTDAKIMPTSDDRGRRVSVGLFTRRGDAERRARAVRSLGLSVQIEEQRQAKAASWVDVDLDSSAQPLPTESLLALEEDGSKLEIAECPSDAQASGQTVTPDKSGAAGVPAAPLAPAPKPALGRPQTAVGSLRPG
jgi:hypothetical protein